jgi:uncharacterized Ntn-hydrolase superfamily protein
VYEIFGAAPGFGVVMAQAALNRQARDRALELLAQGADAPDVIAQITAADFDLAAPIRQYAVIDARGAAAGFTGQGTMPYADDMQGQAGELVFSVQGNILTGAAVIDRAAAAFEGRGCDLADRLMLALEAGAENGEGDSRCTGRGVPADSGFIEVDLPGQAPGSYLRLEVIGTGNDSPVVLLREQYDAWRADNPCPSAAPDAAPEQAPDAGSPDAGSAGGSDAAPAGGAGDTTDDGGCGGCGASERGSKDWRFRVLLLALALAAVRRGLR